MENRRIYDILLHGMEGSELTVDRIVRGISWTGAVLSNGSMGVAMHTEGQTRPRLQGELAGLPVRQAAESVLSWNMEEANEGMAVINAFYNTIDNRERFEQESGARLRDDGALAGLDLTDRTVGIVGHLIGHSGITEEVLASCREYFVLEREPREGDYPDSACEYLIPGCDIVVITGSAAMNKTLPHLLELAKDAYAILTGPSVTLCPDVFSLGVDRLYGVVIEDREGCEAGITAQKGSVNRYASRFCVDKDDLWQQI